MKAVLFLLIGKRVLRGLAVENDHGRWSKWETAWGLCSEKTAMGDFPTQSSILWVS